MIGQSYKLQETHINWLIESRNFELLKRTLMVGHRPDNIPQHPITAP